MCLTDALDRSKDKTSLGEKIPSGGDWFEGCHLDLFVAFVA